MDKFFSYNVPMINAALAACSQFGVSTKVDAAKVAFNHVLAAGRPILQNVCLEHRKIK